MASRSPTQPFESPSVPAPRREPAHDPLEDSQITTMFDGVCGTKSVEVVRSAGGDGMETVIRHREIGHVAEPMC